MQAVCKFYLSVDVTIPVSMSLETAERFQHHFDPICSLPVYLPLFFFPPFFICFMIFLGGWAGILFVFLNIVMFCFTGFIFLFHVVCKQTLCRKL